MAGFRTPHRGQKSRDIDFCTSFGYLVILHLWLYPITIGLAATLLRIKIDQVVDW